VKDIQEVNRYIKFQLNELSVNNAHHIFEDLCLHLTQARICSNILPATGPVSKGGDQGRDFETFDTELKSSPIANSTFIGLKSDKKIAFSCSTAKDIINKIKRDVKSILSHELPCDKIVYFCTENIAVSERHKLEKWAQDKYSILIEIFDGNAITNLLVDRELFWMAIKYLDVSSEIYPRHDEEKDFYIKSLEYWKIDETPILNHASFYEIKESMRHAVFTTTNAKQDIPFWIKTLEKFMDDDFGIELKRRAMYEILVASYRGLGTFIGLENMLREFFDMNPDITKIWALEDYAVLLNYCIPATYNGMVRLEIDELKNWHNLLLGKIEEQLDTNNVNLKCQLLELRGFSQMNPLNDSFEINEDEMINNWIELSKLAENAPLFPINRFSNRLVKLTKFLGNHPKYDYLTKKIDELLSKRYGDHIAAQNCVNRAVEFYENGEVLKAIKQLHQAKIKWFIEETAYNSLISAILISNSYLNLGLSFAAKYYALATAYIAQSSSDQHMKSFVPRALFITARCDYVQGSWLEFFGLMDNAIKSHLVFSKEPLGVNIHDELEKALYHTSMIIFITESFFKEPYTTFVNNRIKKWDYFDEDVDYMASVAIENSPIDNMDDLWLMMEEQLNGRPFGDCGYSREVSWSELGVIWNVNWKNDYNTTAISEQFIAILQIFLVDLASIDLCLLKTDVNISITVNEIENPQVESVPSNSGRNWNIIFPSYENSGNINELQIKFVEVISHIIYDVSLLPIDKLNGTIENCLENGILNKVFIAETYQNLFKFFTDPETFEGTENELKTIPEVGRSFKITSHEELKWFDGPGRGYSREEAVKHLKARYEKSLIPINQTLKRLSREPEFIHTVHKLHDDGWLDWHILLVVNNIAVNYRVDQNMEEYSLFTDIDRNILLQNETEMVLNEEEKENSTVIPVSKFNEDNLRFCLQVTMIDTITRVYGLDCRQMTPDMDAIEHFLGERYNYWKDDIEHEKLF
jgi:hypothetical protein